MLQVENLEVSYGAINALRNVSFHVEQGEIISLIGSNGAGKTTALHAISNIIKKRAGKIIFQGEDITHLAPDMIVRKKLIQVPEGRRIFLNLSVRDNLEMGAFTRNDKDGIRRDMQKVFELFPRLKERVSQISGTLSGGELQMLAMGRALMAEPKLLLLDEPSMGLAPILVDEIFEIVQKINEAGTTVLLVEQNAFKALSISNRAYVLETGEISKEGLASDLANDPAVKEAYLGG
ncbi:MAG: ABC transporter ATP-binding protein [Treponema sp.]|nr:ABC transporter ATP-binding protein [Treponema sp.]